MKFLRRIPTVFVLMLPVAGIWWMNAKPVRKAESPIEEPAASDSASRPHRTKSSTVRATNHAAGELTAERAALVPPDEWEARFKKDYPSVDLETRSQVVELAGELKDSIEQGMDPKSDEARTYGETILVLLDEGTAAE